MYTNEGRYYTGHKTYWHVTVNAAGVVVEILASVKAWDNEGRSFQSPVESLPKDIMAYAIQSTQAQQDVIDALVAHLYNTSVAAEAAAKEADGIPEQTTASAAAVEDAPIPGPGAVLADGQEG
jgi:hypothetical protein